MAPAHVPDECVLAEPGRRRAGWRRNLAGRPLRCYIVDMERADRITILLSAAALCATIIAKSCLTNARIDDFIARIDDMNMSLNARVDVEVTALDADRRGR